MLRLVANISREAFCLKYDINLNTLVSIELNRLKLSSKQLKKIIHAFYQEKIFVTELWIQRAEGPPPARSSVDLKEHRSSFLEKWARFFTEHPYSIVHQILDHSMEPFYAPKDLVGGIWSQEINALLGKKCIVKKEKDFFVGILMQDGSWFTVVPSNLQKGVSVVFTLQQAKIAEILWHVHYNSYQIPELYSFTVEHLF